MCKIVIALLITLVTALPSAAQISFQVTVNTSSLTGIAGPFSIDLQLIDGSGNFLGDSNNSVSISNFLYGGGAPEPSAPTTVGGASGNLLPLLGKVSLSDTHFLNEFYQQFVPGDTLIFSVQMTTNIASQGVPDGFSLLILDGNNLPIPTLGIADELLSVSIDGSTPTVETFRSDLNRTTLNIPVPVVSFDNHTAVPEPSTGLLTGIGSFALFGLYFLRRSRRQAIAPEVSPPA